jgi:hypothetical protein
MNAGNCGRLKSDVLSPPQNPGTIGQMIHDGKITEAHGWIKIGKLNR